MKRPAVRRSTVTLPLLPVPAGIEIAGAPASVTILLAANTECPVAQGALVVRGTPLSGRPAPGTFASVNGTVRRIMPWDGGPRGRSTAVIIDRDESDKAPCRLFDPVNDPFSIPAGELRGKLQAAGFQFPGPNQPLLFLSLDEDIDHVANRWALQKEFGRVVEGLRLLRHLHEDGAIVIALPDSLPVEQRRQCAQFGTIIDVRSTYPDTMARRIVQQYHSHFPANAAVMLDCKRILGLATTLRTGVAPITMQVALRIGRRGQIRLFEIPIGMSVGDLLTLVNHTISDGAMIVIGGEMTGTAADSMTQPLVTGCDSVLVLPRSEAAMHENNPCVNCGRCVEACPEGLRVDLIGKNVEFSREKEAVRLGIHQCTDCGLCTAACIVRRPLGHLLAFGKSAYSPVTEPKRVV